jgi:site-specific recombinase XerD
VVWTPHLCRAPKEGGGIRYSLGHELVDAFLEFAAGRCRPNTVRAYAHDLKAFFEVVRKDPVEVTPSDVMAFVAAQQAPRPGADNLVHFPDAGAGLSPATVMRRLAAVSAFYGYLLTRADTGVLINPVPRGLPARRNRRELRGAPLVRGVRRLPRILDPAEAAALLAALRTRRDRAIVEAMLLGGLRRNEALGLRLEDLRLGECRAFVADGKGGHQRLVPMSPTFFATAAAYLECERPIDSPTQKLFVVLKGPRRGMALSSEGLDEVVSAARKRAGLAHGTCHELRHTCLTRLREAGMSLEALQAQAGHRSIASTQIYLHLGSDWLAAEYRAAADVLESQLAREALG